MASCLVHFSVLSFLTHFLGVACLTIFMLATASNSLCRSCVGLMVSSAAVCALLCCAFPALGSVRGLLHDVACWRLT